MAQRAEGSPGDGGLHPSGWRTGSGGWRGAPVRRSGTTNGGGLSLEGGRDLRGRREPWRAEGALEGARMGPERSQRVESVPEVGGLSLGSEGSSGLVNGGMAGGSLILKSRRKPPPLAWLFLLLLPSHTPRAYPSGGSPEEWSVPWRTPLRGWRWPWRTEGPRRAEDQALGPQKAPQGQVYRELQALPSMGPSIPKDSTPSQLR